ncbi:aminodeoxychorismate synthase component I [Spectribacter hydrogenoxidans]|uniref:Aminodeoxychorismate synthase component I n=1 Tax=Spectribacter hydrogenoxidans TaxID=3075608 RepID=A0ABU3C355_9GAMM|nr:aminodeoxychorismate synthase component I [Salinisphaera sp. W335]MDT0635975.1 aminodeoxychorismate synthase component I [Salinisphaera sp. W335]
MNTAISAPAGCRVRALPLPAAGFDALALHRHNPERYPFLLESSAGAVAQGRYDIVFAFPGEALCLDGRHLDGPGAAGAGGDFLTALDHWRTQVPPLPPGELPFTGGWFVYLGYELAGQVEPHLPWAADPVLPRALAVRCPAALIHDRREQALFAVAEPEAEACLDDLAADLAACGRTPDRAVTVRDWDEDEPERYLDHVSRIREYIRAGDVFQVNLSRAWRARLAPETGPADLYSALRRANPAPFSGLMTWDGASVISSSPERLLRLAGDRADTRPIAGTRPRRGDDAAMTRELMAHPKERAEHVMLIDLERNDLGRVCRYGSVTVDELMTVESYAHVHHIVSNVSGRLRPGVGPGAALRAVFPGGTITGCPKVRCMEIIAELEADPRGAYTGAFGYLGRDGRLDTNILIRSLAQRGDSLSLRAGAGIVADSDPRQELAETRAKARGMLLALGLTA